MKYERRPIPGYEGLYEIDTEGNVWSLGRHFKRTSGWCKDREMKEWTYQPRKLRPVVRSGKLGVRLHDMDGNDKQYSVGLLVAGVFLGCPLIRNDRSSYYQYHVFNTDGDKQNNNVDNLDWQVRFYAKNRPR